ncbi:hypothetical protein T07_4939 [Trichinella nelsoni]|uniref:Uncharacterized protein n=1 Tax=Trichinella nelsoni TaxID=6336 RepID=A0A0V0SMW3_9BILA|nr:hypothetical protein T07_4939 [Trichinella nelsoni]
MKLQRMVVACGCCAGVQRRQGFGAKEMVNVYKNWEMNDSVQGNTPRCLVTTNDDTYFLNVTLDQVLQVDCQHWNGKSAYNLEIWVRQVIVATSREHAYHGKPILTLSSPSTAQDERSSRNVRIGRSNCRFSKIFLTIFTAMTRAVKRCSFELDRTEP